VIALRPYQRELVDEVRSALRASRSVLLQSGTGSGKTATAAEILRMVTARGRRSLFLAHLDSLIEDTHARLVAAGINAGFVQAGRPRDPAAPVQVASLATLHIRGERPPADVVIFDEAHRAASASVRGILEAYPGAFLLGLTATPQRGDGRPLGDVFQKLVCGPSNGWLTEQGFIVPCEVLAPGGYRDGLADDPVKAYVRHTPGRRAIVFAANKAHADGIVDTFTATGISADLVVGETTRDRRRVIRERLRSGELQVLVGVAVFLEGWDCPEVEVVILARPFGTTGAFLQAIGRGLRPAPGKIRCTVIDLRGAVYLHGLPDEDRVWSLDGKAVRRAETIMALARCTECLAVFRPARSCPRCGASCTTATKTPRVLSHAEKLARFDALPEVERDRRYLARLQKIAETRMRMSPSRAAQWARSRFERQFRRLPVSEAA
jgi:superfamily II DNA or RNA helicase